MCFDISDDRIRTRVGKRLLRHGERVQKSVFEIAVKDAAELEEIRSALRGIVEEEKNIRFYRLCAACRGISTSLDGNRVGWFPAVVIL